jgi:hypothetical protein
MNPNLSESDYRFWHYQNSGEVRMTLQKSATTRGRRRKFTTDNIQKIKDWVAEGISREEIAKLIDVTVGSLQVTCSRLGISLRIPKIFDCSGGARSAPVLRRPTPPNHVPMLGQRFQVVLERDGARLVTDVPLAGLDIARLGIEASAQNLGMVQLLTQAVITAVKKDMVGGILGEPSQGLGARGGGRTQAALLTPACLPPR